MPAAALNLYRKRMADCLGFDAQRKAKVEPKINMLVVDRRYSSGDAAACSCCCHWRPCSRCRSHRCSRSRCCSHRHSCAHSVLLPLSPPAPLLQLPNRCCSSCCNHLQLVCLFPIKCAAATVAAAGAAAATAAAASSATGVRAAADTSSTRLPPWQECACPSLDVRLVCQLA
jgi:hypothetical protein